MFRKAILSVFLAHAFMTEGQAMSEDRSDCEIDIPNKYFEFGMNYPSPELDRLFCPYAETIKSFVIKHNMLIHKYYHDASAWSLLFEHPKGGQAKIDFWIRSPDQLEIQSVRWRDEYSKWTRSLKWGERRSIDPDAKELENALSQTLDEMLSWEANDWSQVADGYQPIWSKSTKAEFEARTPDWPKVRP